MVEIRISRLSDFRKKHRSIMVKLFSIFYVSTLILSYATSDTGAFFNSKSVAKTTIQAGHWEEKSLWDKSSLKFVKEKGGEVKELMEQGCKPLKIMAAIKNSGSDMEGTSEFEVYYSESGNPMKKGEKIADGTIEIIKKDGVGEISYIAKEPGNYKFRAFQRPGHGNKEDERHDLWSDTITVECDEEEEKANNDAEREDSEEETESLDQNVEKDKAEEQTDEEESQEQTEDDSAQDETSNEESKNKQDKPPVKSNDSAQKSEDKAASSNEKEDEIAEDTERPKQEDANKKGVKEEKTISEKSNKETTEEKTSEEQKENKE
ncbi:amyloid fiber anchoring/assembly protein TapA [Thalassobacillus sp. B23F22_16]|uniref:amyloid fiber anchoring/assembly protein TapA n=1 Tax=Thalassobacillus sp. B23F22_16 TaxID=3459513 RepID=UPI00373F7179